MNQTAVRPIDEIAAEILEDWRSQKGGVNYAAKPYLSAMFDLKTMEDKYGYDSAKSVVRYFLSNAQTWRGETARRIKKELKEMCK